MQREGASVEGGRLTDRPNARGHRAPSSHLQPHTSSRLVPRDRIDTLRYISSFKRYMSRLVPWFCLAHTNSVDSAPTFCELTDSLPPRSPFARTQDWYQEDHVITRSWQSRLPLKLIRAQAEDPSCEGGIVCVWDVRLPPGGAHPPTALDRLPTHPPHTPTHPSQSNVNPRASQTGPGVVTGRGTRWRLRRTAKDE